MVSRWVKGWWRRLWWGVASSMGLGLVLLLGSSSLQWSVLLPLIRFRYPDVRQLSTQALGTWIADPARRAPQLLDIREKAEYQRSHLPDAHHVTPTTPVRKLAESIDRERPVVLYCSVGVRSSSYAKKLLQAGFKEVYNLEGSIFKWANEGRTLRRKRVVATKVHPYNQLWGRLLLPKHRASLNETKASPAKAPADR